MKLTSLLIVVAAVHVSATTRSQPISLTIESKSLDVVFQEIKSQTGLVVVYNERFVDTETPVSISVINRPLAEALEALLEPLSLSFRVMENTIVITKPENEGNEMEHAGNAAIQPRTISGKVTDAQGMALEGVTVRVRESQVVDVTDRQGTYRIRLPASGKTLVFSMLGFDIQERAIGNQQTIDVVLQHVVDDLDEVIVVGYGEQRKKDITGAISSVGEERIERVSGITIDNRLQGQVAGVNIGATTSEPGGNMNIRIRGNNSISADNSPLIVIDGYPIASPNEASAWGNGGSEGDLPLNLLSSVNPNDVASIEVLKDASAAAIYGSRAANGVIVITTKSGKLGTSELTVNAEVSYRPIPETFNMMSGPQWGTFRNYVRTELMGTDPVYDDPDALSTVDWLKLISKNALSQRYNAALKGGGQQSRYFVSADYLDQDGTIINSTYKRGNLKGNFDFTVTPKLKVSLNVNYNRTAANRQTQSTYSINVGGPVMRALRANPTLDITGADGVYMEADPSDGLFFGNPLVEATDVFDYTDNQNMLANINVNYQVAKGLRLVVTGGSNSFSSLRQQFFPSNTSLGRLDNGRGIYNTAGFNDYRFEPYAHFTRYVAGHRIDATAGYTYQTNVSRSTSYSTFDFELQELGANAMQYGKSVYARNTGKSKRDLVSGYYRLNYDFQSKYYLTLSGRYDGSSVLAAGNKWHFFPAGSVGWTVSNESFMAPYRAVVSLMKIRGSWGITGSQSVSPLSSMTLLSKMNYVSGDTEIVGQGLQSRLGNENLNWEKTTQLNIGLDVGLFGNRVNVAADYYDKVTDGLLQNRSLPMSSGFSTTRYNLGQIQNKGIELSVNADLIAKKDFIWSTSVNFAKNKTNVLDLGGEDIVIEAAGLLSNIMNYSSNIMQQGQPFGAFKGFRVIGLVQPSDFDAEDNPTFAMMNNERRLGTWKFADINDDGEIDALDRVIIGDPNPNFNIGWNNSFSYKRISFSALLYACVGFDVLNANNALMSSGVQEFNQKEDWFINRWTPQNPHQDTRYPGYSNLNNVQVNDQMVEKGSFVRLKSVMVSYDMPFQWGKGLQLYLSGLDLFTITKYSGFDPEVNAKGTDNIIQNVDLGGYPRSKSFLAGIKLTF